MISTVKTLTKTSRDNYERCSSCGCKIKLRNNIDLRGRKYCVNHYNRAVELEERKQVKKILKNETKYYNKMFEAMLVE